ncbi:MAG: UDP-3-O-acyl-N-acetylglucosamine deacetylase [Planctomycetota bacterium]
MASRLQHTLRTQVEFSGTGLHTGKEIHVRIAPAPVDHGVMFARTDMDGAPLVQAHIMKLLQKDRRTSLREGPAEVNTVEHLLAALYSMEVDNALVELDGDELPGLDGSALPVAKLIEEAGHVDQRQSKKHFKLDEPIYVLDEDVSLVALPSDNGLSIQYHLDQRSGETEAIQSFACKISAEQFVRQVAPARTFVMEDEAKELQDAGFGKGATTENTLVIGPNGPLNNQLRFPDEMARHKVLDLIGDLALSGVQLSTHIIATRSGHKANHQLVRLILERMGRREEEGYLEHESGMSIQDILKLLPHRYPFLMVDRVIETEGYQRGVGIKNITFNEPYFQGHWPGQPMMPGVLQLEAMAQMAGILLFRKLENTGKLAVLWSIDKVKLRGAVVPGDQLRIEVETIRSRPGMGHVQARCKVGSKLVAEARLLFTLVDA